MKDLQKIIEQIQQDFKTGKKNYNIDKPEVSVIIPVYNVEEYIYDCLHSVVNQTFENMEIIVVNDGSPDDSAKIAAEFAEYDSRIKIVTQKNAGLSAARNTGMDTACGNYICFIDSDDWVENNFIEKLYTALQEEEADVASATIIRKRKNSQKYRVHYTEKNVYTTLENKINACRIPVCCYVWNKLYRFDKIKKFKFKTGVYYEDVQWTPEVLKQTGKMVTVPDTAYYYRVNKNSIVKKTPSKKKQEDSYNAKKYIIKFFDENNLPLTKKQRTITKFVYYILSIPLLKIKEYSNTQTYWLFGLLPVFKKRV